MNRRHSKDSRILQVTREKCGYQGLRPGQEEAVAAVLEGRDALTIMPTGSGKSAIYQIAGLMKEGSTVVVSPLIALQRDQVESIDRQELTEAAVVNSLQRAGEQHEFIFLAPEQFNHEETASLSHRRVATATTAIAAFGGLSLWWSNRPKMLRNHSRTRAL